MSANVVFVPLHEFKRERLVVEDPVLVTYSRTGTSSNLSKIYYLDDEGKKCEFYFAGAPGFTFGVNKDYAYGKDKTEEDRANPANLKGYKLTYMLTDQSRINAPTDDEKETERVFREVYDAVIQHAHTKRVLDKLSTLIPAQCTLIERARDKHLPHGGIKPIISHAMKSKFEGSKEKVVDPSKPKRIYSKLWTFKDKKTGKIACKTTFHVRGRVTDPSSLLDTNGEIEPVFYIKSVWWGDHKTQPYGGGIQFNLSEAIFVPRQNGPRTFLGAKARETSYDDDGDDLNEKGDDPASDLHSIPDVPDAAPDASSSSGAEDEEEEEPAPVRAPQRRKRRPQTVAKAFGK